MVLFCRNADKQIQFLLLQTNKDRGSFWQNITGSVDPGEDFPEAALREAMEETALTQENVVDMRELGMDFEFPDRWGHQAKEKVFLLECQSVFNPKLDSKEHQDYKWVSKDRINKDSVKYESNWLALQKTMELL